MGIKSITSNLILQRVLIKQDSKDNFKLHY